MVQSKIIRFLELQDDSYLKFKDVVNQHLADIERNGGYTMNVRFERSEELITVPGEQWSGKVFWAYILFNTVRNKPKAPTFSSDPGVPEAIKKDL